MSSDVTAVDHLEMALPNEMSEVEQPGVSGVINDEYQPTYDQAFPPLDQAFPPLSSSSATPLKPDTTNKWNNKLPMRRSTVTQVFCVPVEERKFKEKTEQGFGEQQEQSKICQDIMTKTGVWIEMSSAKDKSLTVVITGKCEAVMKARKMVVQQLQTQARVTLNIPKEHHRFLLGPKGARLADLELNTATKITIPRMDENSDVIIIIGTKEGIEKAQHEIQDISDEQSKLASERLPIPKIYHPFICGPDNNFTKELQDKTGARIRVPPPSVDKGEIVVSGEKEGVADAVNQIMTIYREKERKCQTVSVEVRKSQHKYVIGPRGSNINEILMDHGVSVEVPRLEEPSETITLRGEQDKLGGALTAVYAKANSVVTQNVQAPTWLHRFIIGRKGAKINKVTADFPKVHIEFQDGKDMIELEGPPIDVAAAQEALSAIVEDLIATMAYKEIRVDQKYHKHIIGKQGSNVARIKEETGVTIRIPPDNDHSDVICIKGPPEGVERAEAELLEMVTKMENEKTRDILIDQRFHKSIIGAQGTKIKEIRDRFNQVQITFPDAQRHSDVVTLRGPKADVDRCHRYLQQVAQEMVANNYMQQVHIFKDFHKVIIGKGGNTIRKIRDETDTKIDLPSESADSDVITITGKRPNVEAAKAKIEAIQKELADIVEISVEIPNRFHNAMIGAKGRLIRSVMDECGGVVIRFPPEGTNSDKVIVRGPKDDVEKARKQLLTLANERKESGHTIDVRAKPEYHKFLIGRGGSNVRGLRERTGARIIFPSASDTPEQQNIITLMGRAEAVEAAKKELEARISDMDNVVELIMTVDPKFHRHFVVRRGEVLRQIADDFGGVSVSFPRSGVQSDKVTLKGAKNCVEGARNRIAEIVADLEAQITMECIIPQKFHRTVMGQKGMKVQGITAEFEVNIKFPDRPIVVNNEAGEKPEPVVNGEANGEAGGEGDQAPSKFDVIVITGKKENCEKARDALLNLVPITKEVSVPLDYHRFIIGQRGGEVRQMMSDFDVNISVPASTSQSDIIKITGAPANVARAEDALAEKVRQLDAEKEARLLRSFQLEVIVSPVHHPKIIGRKGAVISKIRGDHNVQIQFPERGAERDDVITITGLEADAEAARDDIMEIVKELEDQISASVEIDSRTHPRIIGGRGRNIRKLMDQYKVDIKFPKPDAENPNLVIISGAEDDVYDCKEHLQNLEEEYLQDIVDQEALREYNMAPSRRQEEPPRGDNKGFVVRDAPWSLTSTSDFPEFGASQQAVAPPPAVVSAPPMWGPRRK